MNGGFGSWRLDLILHWFFFADLGILVNNSTSMYDPPSAMLAALQQQQTHQQLGDGFLPDNSNRSNRHALADFYASCEQRQEAVANSLLDNSSLQERRMDIQQQLGRSNASCRNNVENRLLLSSSFDGMLLNQQQQQQHHSSEPFQIIPGGIRSSRGGGGETQQQLLSSSQRPGGGCGDTGLRFDDLSLLRGGAGNCDNRCEMGTCSQHPHHHHHHHQQQQQQGLASERSLVLTESRNFTLSPETTDCDSGSELSPF